MVFVDAHWAQVQVYETPILLVAGAAAVRLAGPDPY